MHDPNEVTCMECPDFKPEDAPCKHLLAGLPCPRVTEPVRYVPQL